MAFPIGALCHRTVGRQAFAVSRGFSTIPALQNQVPPESPAYIHLPTPAQSEETKPPRVRGYLPVPREIFPRNDGDRKAQPEYIQQTAPFPTKRPAQMTPNREWKLSMASRRRKNLTIALKYLWRRRVRNDSIRNHRVSRTFEQNNAARVSPEREDERLTRSTILDGVMDTKVYPDKHRFEKAERSKKKVEARETAKREARRDSLMELYMNASNFIVNENELKAEIDNIFSEDYFKKQGQAVGRYGHAENTWDIWGKPPTILSMLETTTGTSTKVMDFYESEYDRSVKRQKRIAEEFTGGKME